MTNPDLDGLIEFLEARIGEWNWSTRSTDDSIRMKMLRHYMESAVFMAKEIKSNSRTDISTLSELLK